MSGYPEPLIACIRENRTPTIPELACLAQHIWSDLGSMSTLQGMSGPHCEAILRLANCALQGTPSQCGEHESASPIGNQPAGLLMMEEAI